MSTHNIGFYEEISKIIPKLSSNIYRLLTVYRKIFGTSSYGKIASASPPYERVPNILQYTVNNLFIIYP